MTQGEAIKVLEARVTSAEIKAERAAEVALGAVETIKHMQNAAEHSHAREGEQLAAMRKMVNVVESLSKQILSAPKARKKT